MNSEPKRYGILERVEPFARVLRVADRPIDGDYVLHEDYLRDTAALREELARATEDRNSWETHAMAAMRRARLAEDREAGLVAALREVVALHSRYTFCGGKDIPLALARARALLPHDAPKVVRRCFDCDAENVADAARCAKCYSDCFTDTAPHDAPASEPATGADGGRS